MTPVFAILLTALIQIPAPLATKPIAVRAFEPYEAVRVALAGDRFDEGAIAQAKTLVTLAGELAGAEARDAAQKLAGSPDVKEARKAFGALSMLVVPKFREAKLAGVFAFDCPMVKQPWAQRGDKVENPYFGKSMLTCGNPIRDKK